VAHLFGEPAAPVPLLPLPVEEPAAMVDVPGGPAAAPVAIDHDVWIADHVELDLELDPDPTTAYDEQDVETVRATVLAILQKPAGQWAWETQTELKANAPLADRAEVPQGTQTRVNRMVRCGMVQLHFMGLFTGLHPEEPDLDIVEWLIAVAILELPAHRMRNDQDDFRSRMSRLFRLLRDTFFGNLLHTWALHSDMRLVDFLAARHGVMRRLAIQLEDCQFPMSVPNRAMGRWLAPTHPKDFGLDQWNTPYGYRLWTPARIPTLRATRHMQGLAEAMEKFMPDSLDATHRPWFSLDERAGSQKVSLDWWFGQEGKQTEIKEEDEEGQEKIPEFHSSSVAARNLYVLTHLQRLGFTPEAMVKLRTYDNIQEDAMGWSCEWNNVASCYRTFFANPRNRRKLVWTPSYYNANRVFGDDEKALEDAACTYDIPTDMHMQWKELRKNIQKDFSLYTFPEERGASAGMALIQAIRAEVVACITDSRSSGSWANRRSLDLFWQLWPFEMFRGAHRLGRANRHQFATALFQTHDLDAWDRFGTDASQSLLTSTDRWKLSDWRLVRALTLLTFQYRAACRRLGKPVPTSFAILERVCDAMNWGDDVKNPTLPMLLPDALLDHVPFVWSIVLFRRRIWRFLHYYFLWDNDQLWNQALADYIKYRPRGSSEQGTRVDTDWKYVARPFQGNRDWPKWDSGKTKNPWTTWTPKTPIQPKYFWKGQPPRSNTAGVYQKAFKKLHKRNLKRWWMVISNDLEPPKEMEWKSSDYEQLPWLEPAIRDYGRLLPALMLKINDSTHNVHMVIAQPNHNPAPLVFEDLADR
jgi:hypothetical protein